MIDWCKSQKLLRVPSISLFMKCWKRNYKYVLYILFNNIHYYFYYLLMLCRHLVIPKNSRLGTCSICSQLSLEAANNKNMSVSDRQLWITKKRDHITTWKKRTIPKSISNQ